MVLSGDLHHREMAQKMSRAQPLFTVQHGAHEIRGIDKPLHQRVAAALADEGDGLFGRLHGVAGMNGLRLIREAELLHKRRDDPLVAGEYGVPQPLVEGQLHRLDSLPVRRRGDQAASAETATVIYHFIKCLIHRYSSRQSKEFPHKYETLLKYGNDKSA